MKKDNRNASDVNQETKRPAKRLATGPRSEEGKLRSARNATSHGVFANSVIIPGESLSRCRALIRALRDDLGMTGATQEIIIEKLVATLWRQARLYRAEGGAFLRSSQLNDRFAQELPDDLKPLGSNNQSQQTSTDGPIIPSSEQLAILIAYDRHLSREIDRLFNQLECIRRLKQFVRPRSNSTTPPSARRRDKINKKRGDVDGQN